MRGRGERIATGGEAATDNRLGTSNVSNRLASSRRGDEASIPIQSNRPVTETEPGSVSPVNAVHAQTRCSESLFYETLRCFYEDLRIYFLQT
jgi:hypothetical protein